MYSIAEAPEVIFKSKSEMFSYLKSNEKQLISIKNSNVQKSGKATPILTSFERNAVKSIEGLDNDFIYPIISITNLVDSHTDVHFQKCFNRTQKNQQGKILYALDHDLKMGSIIAWEDEVEMLVKTINMRDINLPYDMDCDILMFKIKKETLLNCKIPSVVRVIEKARAVANSIRMKYFKIFLAINEPDNEEYAENYKYFLEYKNKIANIEQVNELGYFWGVTELGIIDEGSMVVKPSQSAATTIYPEIKTEENKSDSLNSTQFKIVNSSSDTSQTSNYCLI